MGLSPDLGGRLVCPPMGADLVPLLLPLPDHKRSFRARLHRERQLRMRQPAMTDAHLVPDEAPPKQEKRPREAKRGGWFIIDQELIELMQVPEPIARAAIQAWDKNPRESRFPQKIGLLGDRRFRPAVEAYFEYAYGFKLGDHSKGGQR